MDEDKKRNLKKTLRRFAIFAAIAFGLTAGFMAASSRSTAVEPAQASRNSVAVLMEKEQPSYLKDERPFSDLLGALSENKVALMGVTTDGEVLVRGRNGERFYVHAPAPAQLLTEAMSKAKDAHTTVVTLRSSVATARPAADVNVMDIIKNVLSVVLLVLLLVSLRGSFGMFGKKDFQAVEDSGVRFDDVIGAEDAKKALSDVVAYLRNPKKFADIGAQAPKGVLLEGPPGTGKTLLAKAVAGECGVPFLSLNGASFTAPFVGVGVMRVKQLFKEAAAKAPCVIFIDEIDGIGSREQTGQGGAAETENSRIINAMLTELDGFDTSKGIVVIGATNYGARLDSALTREGRFDRKCTLTLPNIQERKALFELYGKKIKVDGLVDWSLLARRSAGMAPSGIAAVVNIAALRAAQDERATVSQADLVHSVEQQQMGAPSAAMGASMSEALRNRIAVHEAGHALVSWKLGMGTLDGVTIIPRSRALGVTLITQENEEVLFTGSELRAKISTFLAGRAAEKLELGEASTGASNDLERASAIAMMMVADTGLAGSFGPFSLKALGREAELLSKSKAMRDAMSLMREIEAETDNLLLENRAALQALARELLEKETLSGEEARSLLEQATRKELPVLEAPDTVAEEVAPSISEANE